MPIPNKRLLVSPPKREGQDKGISYNNFLRSVLLSANVDMKGVFMLAIIKRKILLLFLLAFVLRLIVFLLHRPWDSQVLTESVLVHDASDYHRFALSIIDHFSFGGETYRTPGYPFFIAVIYVIFGVKPWLVLFIQIFVDLVTIYYVLRIGEFLFSRRVGIIAAAFLAIDPNSIFTTARFLSDGLSVAFLMASMYFYLRGLKRGMQGVF